MPQVAFVQRTPEWYAARQGLITSSTAAACLGLCPYDGLLAAFRAINGKPKEQNKHMAWGEEYEPQARWTYELETGETCYETGFWVHPQLPWLGASPDSLVGESGGVEIKCPSQLPTSIPEHHRIQCMVCMAVTDRPWWDYFVWCGAQIYRERVVRDEVQELEMIAQLNAFRHAFLLPNVEPPRTKVKGLAIMAQVRETWAINGIDPITA